jgi:hypothetical protein
MQIRFRGRPPPEALRAQRKNPVLPLSANPLRFLPGAMESRERHQPPPCVWMRHCLQFAQGISRGAQKHHAGLSFSSANGQFSQSNPHRDKPPGFVLLQERNQGSLTRSPRVSEGKKQRGKAMRATRFPDHSVSECEVLKLGFLAGINVPDSPEQRRAASCGSGQQCARLCPKKRKWILSCFFVLSYCTQL